MGQDWRTERVACVVTLYQQCDSCASDMWTVDANPGASSFTRAVRFLCDWLWSCVGLLCRSVHARVKDAAERLNTHNTRPD